MEQLLKEINDRLVALGENASETRIKQLVESAFQSLVGDEQFTRKMKFGANKDERLLGTKYYRWNLSLADVEWLYDLQMSLRGMQKSGGGIYSGPSETLQRTFDALSKAFYLDDAQVREIDRKALDDLFPRIPLHLFPHDEQELAKRGAFDLMPSYRRAVRAMDTAESGYGSQLVGAQYVGDLWDAARFESVVMALIDTFEMTAPTAYLPVEVDIPALLFVSESTASNSSNYTTVKTGSQRVQVDAKKFVIHQMWSGEMEEDSLIPFVPFLRRQQQFSLAYYGDALVLNGDNTNAGTGNINSDDADPTDTNYYLAFDGIRHAAIVDNTANKHDAAGAIGIDRLIKMKQMMKDTSTMINVHWGKPTNPDDLVYVANDETADAIALLDEVLTVDKYGSNATVLNGEVAKVGRNRLLTSLAIPLTDADGKYTTTSPSSNDTKGQVLAFNRRAFKWGWRRRVRTETERLPGTDQTRIVTSMRAGFGRFSPTGAASGIEAAALEYNITV